MTDIINRKDISGVSSLDFDDIINAMIRGGWPDSLNIEGDNKYKVATEYVQSLINEDVVTIDGVERDKYKMSALLKSISRNLST